MKCPVLPGSSRSATLPSLERKTEQCGDATRAPAQGQDCGGKHELAPDPAVLAKSDKSRWPGGRASSYRKKISFRCFSGRRFAHGQSRRSAPAGCLGRQLAGRILRHQVRAIADRQTSIEVLVNDDRLTGQRIAPSCLIQL